MKPVDLFLDIGKTMTIVHHVPGRIRLRFSAKSLPLLKQFGTLEALDDTDVKGVLAAIPGIKNVKINEIVGSATIEYERAEWTGKLWENLCAGNQDPSLEHKIATSLESLGLDLTKDH